MVDVFFVRHAKSAPGEGVKDEEVPLTEIGHKQANDLVKKLDELKPDAFYSSPYKRAFETIEPYTSHYHHRVVTLPNLREKAHAIPWGKDVDFFAEIRKFWDDFDHALPGGESNRMALDRFASAVNQVVRQKNNKRLVIASHGTVIGLFLNSIDPHFGYEEWKAMPMPCMSHVGFDGNNFQLIDKGF